MIGNILAAIDGSEPARRALDFACEPAEGFRAEPVLVTVAPDQGIPEPLMRFAQVEHIEARAVDIYGTILENTLNGVRRKVEDAGAKAVRTRVEIGDPAKNMLAGAETA